jgi:hypothetical protein
MTENVFNIAALLREPAQSTPGACLTRSNKAAFVIACLHRGPPLCDAPGERAEESMRYAAVSGPCLFPSRLSRPQCAVGRRSQPLQVDTITCLLVSGSHTVPRGQASILRGVVTPCGPFRSAMWCSVQPPMGLAHSRTAPHTPGAGDASHHRSAYVLNRRPTRWQQRSRGGTATAQHSATRARGSGAKKQAAFQKSSALLGGRAPAAPRRAAKAAVLLRALVGHSCPSTLALHILPGGRSPGLVAPDRQNGLHALPAARSGQRARFRGSHACFQVR